MSATGINEGNLSSKADAEQSVTKETAPRRSKQPLPGRDWIARAFCLSAALITCGAGARVYRHSLPLPDDVVARLQRQIDGGQVQLAYDERRGYLPAVLDALKVPVSSQMLVFARDSVQKDLISPSNPRALYFNDNVYIGYVPGGKSLEIATHDAHLGPVYYVLLQRPAARPSFFRSTDACLKCHVTPASAPLAEHLMRSLATDADGEPIPQAPIQETTDASPLSERWGGWFVTGRHGSQRHLGNAFATTNGATVAINRESGANLTTLRGLTSTDNYLIPSSDIVALMVMGHQTHLQNLLARARFETMCLSCPQAASGSAAGARLRSACEPLIRALLFSGEARLTAPVEGVSGFASEFSARGPRDHTGRSLRQLDLKTRLFRYPCSYLIYSDAFDALPDEATHYLYGRLWDILGGQDKSREFSHLTAADRIALRQILLETKPAFAAWKAGKSDMPGKKDEG